MAYNAHPNKEYFYDEASKMIVLVDWKDIICEPETIFLGRMKIEFRKVSAVIDGKTYWRYINVRTWYAIAASHSNEWKRRLSGEQKDG